MNKYVKQILRDDGHRYTVVSRYFAPHYYADSDITWLIVDPDFLPPGKNAKWACLSLPRIALTILKKH